MLTSSLYKTHTCHNNSKKSSTAQINKHATSHYLLITHCLFDVANYYRSKAYMKNICKDLEDYTTKIINNEKKEMLPLTTEENKLYHEQNVCYTSTKINNEDNDNDKVRDHCHFTGKYRETAHNVCNLNYKAPRKISLVFHNDSIHDYVL